jgi:hypothetical protein
MNAPVRAYPWICGFSQARCASRLDARRRRHSFRFLRGLAALSRCGRGRRSRGHSSACAHPTLGKERFVSSKTSSKFSPVFDGRSFADRPASPCRSISWKARLEDSFEEVLADLGAALQTKSAFASAAKRCKTEWRSVLRKARELAAARPEQAGALSRFTENLG